MQTQEFLNKTYKTYAKCIEMQEVRPLVICNDGFTMSIQAGWGIYSNPQITGKIKYYAVEIGFPSNEENLITKYAENKVDLTETVYAYVPIEIVDNVIRKHNGINLIKTFKKEMITFDELQTETRMFTGTSGWYRFSPLSKLTITDGIKYITDKYKCYWILDIITSYQNKFPMFELQVWEIKVNEKTSSAIIQGKDGNLEIYVTQKIPFTDLNVEKIVFWCQNQVIYLPSEH